MCPTRPSKTSSHRHPFAGRSSCLVAAGLASLATCAVSGAGSAKVDFNFQVRPILADRCFKCHGPDEKARKAKLRLDLSQSAYTVRDDKTTAIVPGHPEQS